MPFQGLEPQGRMNLGHAFLKVVVAQVRFPYLYEIEEPGELITRLQKALAGEYPNALPREETIFAISIGPSQAERPQKPFGPYRFKSTDEKWQVSLAPDFVALEATDYDDWDEFGSRLLRVLESVNEVLEPATSQRLGLRYVNEIPLDTADEWRQLFSRELLGLAADDAVSDRVVQTAAQATFSIDDHFLTARWGLLLKDGTPAAFALDLDSFMGPSDDFSVERLLSCADSLKKTCWSFFRASVTDEFLTRAGAAK